MGSNSFIHLTSALQFILSTKCRAKDFRKYPDVVLYIWQLAATYFDFSYATEISVAKIMLDLLLDWNQFRKLVYYISAYLNK